MVKCKGLILALNSGIGAHLGGYVSQGLDVRLALEVRDKERENFQRNLGIPIEPFDPRWIYNRKDKGTADLLQRLRLKKIGALDVLDVTSSLNAFDEKGKPQNLFDAFGIARRLKPKIVIAYAPSTILQNENRQRFHSFLDYLRYDNLRNQNRERSYFVSSDLVNASNYGAGVSKQFTLIIGLRTDVAKPLGISADQAIRYLLPKHRKSGVFHRLEVSDTESAFWFEKTREDQRLARALRYLPKSPEIATVFNPSVRLKQELGFPASGSVSIARASFNSPIPDAAQFKVIHPTINRLLTVSEMKELYGISASWKKTGSDVDMMALITHSIPVALTKAVVRSVVIPVLDGSVKIKVQKDPVLRKIALAETLSDPQTKDKTYICETDLGFDYSKRKSRSEPSEKDFDFLFDANEINKDFTVYGAFDVELGRRPIIGAVKRKVFKGKDRTRLVKAIRRVKTTTDKRIGASPILISKERLARYDEDGRDYVLSADGKSVTLWIEATPTRERHLDRQRGEAIPSATYGWSPDKNTKIPSFAHSEQGEQAKEDFGFLNQKAERSYYQLAPIDFIKQRTFLNKRTPREYRLGGSVFTTLAINQYGGTKTPMSAMCYHQDQNTADGKESGLTTITAFDEGAYGGGYFIIPRYRCGFRLGDGDVFVTNSQAFHGVSPLEGDGERLSVVSYTKTTLGYKEYAERAYPARSPRPNFRWNQYQISIVTPPNFGKDAPIKTLEFLDRQNVDMKRVNLISPTSKLWHSMFEENTPILFMSHDVEEYITQIKGADLIGLDFETEVVRRGFDACRESNAYLFSWTNTATDEDEDGEPRVFQKLENAIEVGQFHPSPTCIGVIYRKGMRTVYQPNEQVSYAMGMEHFAKDGRIIRLASVRDNFDYELSVSTQSYPKLRDEDLPPFLSKVEPPKRQRSSKNKILAVAGVPASGKTTIMREFLKRTGNWQKRKLKQSLDALYNRKLDCFILGSYEENETFAGTDRLSMSIQPQTVEFVKETKSKVIYEGDRLFNASFLEVCRAEKIGFKIFEISATDATLKQRHKLRKDKQSKTFLESRATKVRNVCRSPSFFRDVVGFENENDTDMEEIISEMVDFCGKK